MNIQSGASTPVQKIKERLSIEEVISSYIKLEQIGANLKARCPFHNEKSPSFFVSPDRNSYYCFGCGAKGDIFTFVEEFEGLDFKGALKLLAEKAGVSLSEFKKENVAEISEKEKLYSIMEKAEEYFVANLKNENEALEYLKQRGVSEKTVTDFRIGFAKSEWRGIDENLGKFFSKIDLEKAGLIKKTEKGYYDRFRSRIMFPIKDSSGRTIAFSGRLFVNEKDKNEGNKLAEGAKYINSPETPIFKKSSVLFGIDRAKDSIRKNDFSIIVEGQFDLIMSHQAGFRNTVATSGTALSEKDQSEDYKVNSLGLIKRLSQNVVFVFDPDKAGFAASMRAASIALALDMNVKASDIGEGIDPADLIAQKGVDAWKEVIRNAKHIIEFLLDKFISNISKDQLKMKLEVESKILPYLVYIQNPVKKSHFISVISHKTGIREEDIREILKSKFTDEKQYENNEDKILDKKTDSILFKKDYILRRLLGIILWQKSLAQNTLPLEDIVQKLQVILNKKIEDVLLDFENDTSDLIFEAENFYNIGTDLNQDVKEMLANLEEENLKIMLSQKMLDLQFAEKKSDKDKINILLKEIGDLNNQVQNIKSGRVK
ncbi:MAG: DNA primase [Candidatus Pacebacteria bacterium]|nr:DNA primase [Candidatus Paceibacterota bacterium]MCF7862964.1 DNA primase [Candidatus Paceibacterota bacterium]